MPPNCARDCPFAADWLPGEIAVAKMRVGPRKPFAERHKLTLSSISWLHRTGANFIAPPVSTAHALAAPARAPPHRSVERSNACPRERHIGHAARRRGCLAFLVRLEALHPVPKTQAPAEQDRDHDDVQESGIGLRVSGIPCHGWGSKDFDHVSSFAGPRAARSRSRVTSKATAPRQAGTP